MADLDGARVELVERLDKLAVLMEGIALEALDDERADLAADLWVASSRVLAAADELWAPVGERMIRLDPDSDD